MQLQNFEQSSNHDGPLMTLESSKALCNLCNHKSSSSLSMLLRHLCERHVPKDTTTWLPNLENRFVATSLHTQETNFLCQRSHL